MAKKSRPAPARVPTQRQLSRWRRERKIQRITVITGCVFLAFVLAYVGYGYYAEELRPLGQPVLKVDDAVFKMDYYLKLFKLYSQGQEDAMLPAVAELALGAIEQGEIIRREAARLGFTVSKEDVEKELKAVGLSNHRAYTDFVTARLFTGRMLKDYFDARVPVSCEQAYTQAMLLQDEETAKAVAERIAKGEDFLALAKESTVEAVTKSYGGDLGWVPKGYADRVFGIQSPVFEEIVFSLEPGAMSAPIYDASATKNIGYWIIEVLEKDESKGRHIRGILLGTKKEAMEIRERLENGEDFAALAREFSQDESSKEQGGDLGWMQRWSDTSTLVQLAFRLEPGSFSQPTPDITRQTKGGYWLIKVVEREAERKLSDEIRDSLKMDAFTEWLTEVRGNYNIEKLLTQEQQTWAVKRVMKERGE